MAPRESRLELLEHRHLMSATVSPAFDVLNVTSTTPYGLTPTRMRNNYGFSSVTFKSGNTTVQGNGAGQTIAIVDAYGDWNIAADLAKFDSTYGLAALPDLRIVNETGGANLPATNASWALETALDVEWANAIAPGANILLVEANTSSSGRPADRRQLRPQCTRRKRGLDELGQQRVQHRG